MRRYFTRKIHISWLIAWASSGLIAGIALSLLDLNYIFISSIWLIIAVSLLFISITNKRRVVFILALLSGLIIGLWRGSTEQISLSNFQPYYRQHVQVIGKVVEDAAYGKNGDQQLKLTDLEINNHPLHGKLWVSLEGISDVKRGDFITITGTLNEGFGNTPASIYRAEIVSIERPYPGDIGRRVRDWFAGGAKNGINEPESGLGLGFLVGQRSALPENLDSQLKMIGLTHIIVASGYNLTILVSFACRLLSRKSKYLSAISGGFMISGFILITGFSPSMSRAGLVSGLGLMAWYYGRKIHPLVLLPCSAAITAVINPSFVWGDIGWYLSFAAFAGVLILAPLLHHYFWSEDKKPHLIRRLLIETASAQLATLPIIIFIFGKYSVYALLANLLVLPLIPFTMALTFAGGLLSLVFTSLASALCMPAYLLLHYIVTVVDLIANLPSPQSDLIIGRQLLIGSYIFLIGLAIYLWRKTGHDFRKSSAI